MNKLHLKPGRPGYVIRDPHTKRALPDNGGHVPDTSFWRRRIKRGEAVPVYEAPPKYQPSRATPAQKAEE